MHAAEAARVSALKAMQLGRLEAQKEAEQSIERELFIKLDQTGAGERRLSASEIDACFAHRAQLLGAARHDHRQKARGLAAGALPGGPY